MREKKKRTPELISQKTAIEQYGVTKKIIEQYFPKPVVRYTRNHRYLRLWPRQAVEEAVSQPEVLKLIGEAAALRRRDKELSEARELLLDPERSVKEISLEVGYMDPNYFSRIFKKQTGMTPREYREEQLK